MPSRNFCCRSRWRELLRSSAPVGTAASAPPAPVWHGIRLRRTLSLAAKAKFKIVVVLREPQTNNGHERTKGVDGPKGHRRIRDERTVRRARWPVVTGGIGVLLAGALVTANLVPDSVVTADPSIECVGWRPRHRRLQRVHADHDDGRREVRQRLRRRDRAGDGHRQHRGCA